MQQTLFLYNITLMLNRGGERRRLTTTRHASITSEVLRGLGKHRIDVYAWMIMPDHIHLLFGRSRKFKDVDTFAGRVKRLINKAFEQKGLAKLNWRDGCVKYDVTVAELAKTRDYIFANPVRGQLVATADEWDYSGTLAPLPVGA